MLWIGDRTRFSDSEHVDFVSSINNPIGIKIGPSITEKELVWRYFDNPLQKGKIYN